MNDACKKARCLQGQQKLIKNQGDSAFKCGCACKIRNKQSTCASIRIRDPSVSRGVDGKAQKFSPAGVDAKIPPRTATVFQSVNKGYILCVLLFHFNEELIIYVQILHALNMGPIK